MRRPRCFFDIAINRIPSGRIIFELFSDLCPKTCENFRALCTGEKGEGKTTHKPLHFENTPIHRIVKGFIIQGGDFSAGNGTGGESIYGGTFPDENLETKHDKKFLLSMANHGPDTNGSQFFILRDIEKHSLMKTVLHLDVSTLTTRVAPHLDGVHVVFGQIMSGEQFVMEIENQKVDSNHRPYADVTIVSCGELIPMKKSKKKKVAKSESESDSESESSISAASSSSADEKQKGKKKKKTQKTKRKHGKKKKKSKPESDVESVNEPEPDPGVELPPEIAAASRQSWLYRYSKSPPGRSGEKSRNTHSKERRQEREPKQSVRMSASGREIKGRGSVRYRTPPSEFNSSRERSWRRDHSRHYPVRPQWRTRNRSRSRSPSRRDRGQEWVRSRRRSPPRGSPIRYGGERHNTARDRSRDGSRSPSREDWRRRNKSRTRSRSGSGSPPVRERREIQWRPRTRHRSGSRSPPVEGRREKRRRSEGRSGSRSPPARERREIQWKPRMRSRSGSRSPPVGGRREKRRRSGSHSGSNSPFPAGRKEIHWRPRMRHRSGSGSPVREERRNRHRRSRTRSRSRSRDASIRDRQERHRRPSSHDGSRDPLVRDSGGKRSRWSTRSSSESSSSTDEGGENRQKTGARSHSDTKRRWRSQTKSSSRSASSPMETEQNRRSSGSRSRSTRKDKGGPEASNHTPIRYPQKHEKPRASSSSSSGR